MSWTLLTEAKGSNEGGFQKSPDKRRQYVKFMDDAHMLNELLAIRLQEAAGTLVPHARVQNVNGRKAQTSPQVPVKTGKPGQHFVRPEDQIKSIGMHIFLANWDALTAGNIGYVGTDVIILDAGGSMRFRAMGGLRKFLPELPEWEEFQKSKRYSWLFRATSRDELLDSVQNVLTLSDATIDSIVDSTWEEVSPDLDTTLKDFYKDTLKARRRAMQDKVL